MTPDRVLRRLSVARDATRDYRRKVHTIRKTLAGDTAADSFEFTQQDAGQIFRRSYDPEFGDIFVKDVDVGKSNKVLQNVKNLTYMIAHVFPDIEIQNVPPHVATLMSEYLRVRLGSVPFGCEAAEQMKLSLIDLLAGGRGMTCIGLEEGLPSLKYLDTLDCFWDPNARLPGQERWIAPRFRLPVERWKAMFGNKAVNTDGHKSGVTFDMTNGASELDADDQVVEMVFYFDREDNWMVFQANGEAEYDPKPVHTSTNPWYFEKMGRKIDVLPVTTFQMLTLPSVQHPMGVVEGMLPAQYALYRAYENIQNTIDRGQPYYVAEEGALTEEEFEAFMAGETGGLLTVAQGRSAPVREPALEVSQNQLTLVEMLERNLTAASGVTPYVAGDVVSGTNYAAEVNAIRAESGLIAATVGKLNARFWEQNAKLFLIAGKLYDDEPIEVNVSDEVMPFDGVPEIFGGEGSIKKYIDLDASIIIREQSMMFADDSQRIAQARAKFQDMAQAAQLGFTGGIMPALEDLLVAYRVRNIGEYMKQPQNVAPVTGAA